MKQLSSPRCRSHDGWQAQHSARSATLLNSMACVHRLAHSGMSKLKVYTGSMSDGAGGGDRGFRGRGLGAAGGRERVGDRGWEGGPNDAAGA